MSPPADCARHSPGNSVDHQGGFMQNDRIVFRDLESPLGRMIAGATNQGVCFLEWHDRGGVERIKERVEKRYKMPLEKGNNRHLDKLEKELATYFAGKLKAFRVSVDVTGTPFESKTWEQLLAIPYGQTRSYTQIAQALGKPGARRAVGRANGANYLSIVIPCHRVIEANGNLRGYGGKVWRKKYLLELEAGLNPALPE
jgi:AraC family transcriptional regulator of adaptative response/methylated-DNA-[protein]-cysteine methyltransferase